MQYINPWEEEEEEKPKKKKKKKGLKKADKIRNLTLSLGEALNLIMKEEVNSEYLISSAHVHFKPFFFQFYILFALNFYIENNCLVNCQAKNILSNFGSRKTEIREMIGSSVKDFGSFYQKPLEPIFSKDSNQVW